LQLAGAVATLAITQSVWVQAVILIILTLILLGCATVGAVPNITYKDVSIGFAKIEPARGYLPKAEFEQQREAIPYVTTRLEKTLRKELEAVSTRLEDYILAHGPAPDDGLTDDGLTDEKRLDDWRQAFHDLDSDLTYRCATGEGHDDGISTHELGRARDTAEEMLEREERRQQAQFEYGLRAEPPKPRYWRQFTP
jgi:hypothetical protein